jgi:hypothetical protein
MTFLFCFVASLNSAQKSVSWAGYEWFLRNDSHSGPGKY